MFIVGYCDDKKDPSKIVVSNVYNNSKWADKLCDKLNSIHGNTYTYKVYYIWSLNNEIASLKDVKEISKNGNIFEWDVRDGIRSVV